MKTNGLPSVSYPKPEAPVKAVGLDCAKGLTPAEGTRDTANQGQFDQAVDQHIRTAARMLYDIILRWREQHPNTNGWDNRPNSVKESERKP